MAKKIEVKKTAAPKAKSNAVGIGIGLSTAAVAAASAYFLYGSKSAAKNRKTVKSWALKAKAEVLEKLEDAQEMTQEESTNSLNQSQVPTLALRTRARRTLWNSQRK